MPENDNESPREHLAVEIPEETKRLLEEQDGYMWEAVTTAVHSTYGGERLASPAAINQELEHMRRRRRNARERIEDAKDDHQRYEQRLEALKERRDELESESYEREE